MVQAPAAPPRGALRYLEQRPPVVFPESAEVPETETHLLLRTILYQLLVDEFGEHATVGSDQFVYLAAEDPSRVLAPDVYLRRSPRTDLVRSWKVWERGAPELCVEITSDSDASETSFQTKLERYRELGVTELVRFDVTSAEQPLRIWDRVAGALVERQVSGTSARSLVLGLTWVVAPADELASALRLARGEVLLPTRLEARNRERQAKDDERRAKDDERRAKDDERRAREVAEARVRELEAELRRRR